MDATLPNTKIINCNKTLYDYNISLYKELTTVTKLLKDYYGLHIGYIRIFNNNKYFLLHEDANFLSKYLFYLDNDCIFGNQNLGSINNSGYIYNFWPALPDQHPSMLTHYNAGYWNGFDIIKKCDGYTDLWSFYRKIDDVYFNLDQNFYIKNINALNNYIAYFNNFIEVQIINFERKDLATFTQSFDFSNVNNSSHRQDNMDSFVSELEQLNFLYNGKNIKFSNREKECLQILSLGCTMKQIAQELAISPRTVETYINQIKVKTGLIYKRDLIKFFINNSV